MRSGDVEVGDESKYDISIKKKIVRMVERNALVLAERAGVEGGPLLEPPIIMYNIRHACVCVEKEKQCWFWLKKGSKNSQLAIYTVCEVM